jgi:hypothetical protein
MLIAAVCGREQAERWLLLFCNQCDAWLRMLRNSPAFYFYIRVKSAMFQIRLFVTYADVFLQSEAADVLHTDLMTSSCWLTMSMLVTNSTATGGNPG